MKDLIITGGNTKHFHFLQLFVKSLRQNGRYDDYIVVCDNTIGGEWDQPENYYEVHSFSVEEMNFFRQFQVEVIPYYQLIHESGVERQQIDQIPSYTQRYPHKYIYTTLISRLYLGKAKNICFFDADIYFQKPVTPIFEVFKDQYIYMVKEYQKIGKSPFLKKWIAHSDFSKLSSQDIFEKRMFGSEDFCTGFFGGKAKAFHQLTLLALLLTSNQFVEFYSDQPLMNILKSFFNYPIRELSDAYVMHLGELPQEDLVVKERQVWYKNKASIAVHFNGGTKGLFDKVNTANPLNFQLSPKNRLLAKMKRKSRKLYGALRKFNS